LRGGQQLETLLLLFLVGLVIGIIHAIIRRHNKHG
jgi:uncharacterized membrane protein YqaE (UPF0057 family)